MPAVRYINSDNQIGAPGAYVKEIAPSAPVRGLIRNTVGVTGECVRGPIGRLVECASYKRFTEVFGERDKGVGGTLIGKVWKMFQGKRFGRVVVGRAAAAAAVVASFNAETAAGGAGTEVLKIAAANPGTWGNDVSWKVTAATNAVSTSFNLTIRYLGKDYLFENLSINSTDDNLALTLGPDLDANLIVLTKLAAGRPVNSIPSTDGADTSGFTKLGQVVASFTSVAGTDGAIADSDFTAAGKPMEQINAYAGVGICLVAGRSNTAIKTKILALTASASQRVWLACPDSEAISVATAITEIGTLRNGRLSYCVNHVYIVDPFTTETIVEEPHTVMASVLSQTEPDVHPGDVDNAYLGAGVVRTQLELSDADRDALDLAGGTYFNRDLDQNGNPVMIFGNGRTTDLASNNSQLDGRRQKDFIISGVAQRLKADGNKSNTPTRRENRKGAVGGWLTGLARQERFVAVDESSNQPVFEIKNGSEVNVQSDVDNGLQKDLLRVKFIPKGLYLELLFEGGTDVSITELGG